MERFFWNPLPGFKSNKGCGILITPIKQTHSEVLHDKSFSCYL